MSETTPTPSWRIAIEEAIEKAKGKTALMRLLNDQGWEISSHNVISQWVENGVPSKYCPDIETLTGITCERLCPAFPWDRIPNLHRPKQPAQS